MMDLDIGVVQDVEKRQKKRLLLDYLADNLKHHNWWAYRYFFCEFLALVNIIGKRKLHLGISLYFYWCSCYQATDKCTFTFFHLNFNLQPFLNVFPAYFWKCCNLNSDILQDMLEIHLKNDVNKKSTFNLFNTSSTFLCYMASFRENIKYRTTCLLSFFFTLKNIIFWYWNILFLLKSTQLKIGYNNRTVCHLQLLGKKG